MTKFTDAQRATIFEQSRRILTDEPKAPTAEQQPAPVREVVVPEPEDAMDRWRREAAESDRAREAERSAMRRQEREEREAIARARALDGIAARVTVLEQRMAEAGQVLSELGRAVAEYSDAVSEGMLKTDKYIEALKTEMTALRAADDQHRAADFPRLVRRTN
jgi:hypothetical protein